jgi:hypothetical protein
VPGAPRAEKRRIPPARAAGTFPAATSEYSSSGEEEEEEEESDEGQASPERWQPAPPHRELQKWQRNKRPGRARKRLPPGSLRKRWRTL